MGTTVMDRNNRIGRRERREILKSTQGLGKGVVDADKGELEPLRPNTILRVLEESIARRMIGATTRAFKIFRISPLYKSLRSAPPEHR